MAIKLIRQQSYSITEVDIYIEGNLEDYEEMRRACLFELPYIEKTEVIAQKKDGFILRCTCSGELENYEVGDIVRFIEHSRKELE